MSGNVRQSAEHGPVRRALIGQADGLGQELHVGRGRAAGVGEVVDEPRLGDLLLVEDAVGHVVLALEVFDARVLGIESLGRALQRVPFEVELLGEPGIGDRRLPAGLIGDDALADAPQRGRVGPPQADPRKDLAGASGRRWLPFTSVRLSLKKAKAGELQFGTVWPLAVAVRGLSRGSGDGGRCFYCDGSHCDARCRKAAVWPLVTGRLVQ